VHKDGKPKKEEREIWKSTEGRSYLDLPIGWEMLMSKHQERGKKESTKENITNPTSQKGI